MRIPERAHWVAWRLYLSFSHNATRARPLSSLHQAHQLDFQDSRRSHQDWTKLIAPKDVLSTPLRHFLASSERSRSVFSNVCPLLRFPFSSEREVGQGDGKVGITEEDKISATTVCSEHSESSQGECSSSPPVGLKGVGGSGWSKEEVVNWPNAISIGRLLSGPLLAWYISRMLTIKDLFQGDHLLITLVGHHCSSM